MLQSQAFSLIPFFPQTIIAGVVGHFQMFCQVRWGCAKDAAAYCLWQRTGGIAAKLRTAAHPP